MVTELLKCTYCNKEFTGTEYNESLIHVKSDVVPQLFDEPVCNDRECHLQAFNNESVTH